MRRQKKDNKTPKNQNYWKYQKIGIYRESLVLRCLLCLFCLLVFVFSHTPTYRQIFTTFFTFYTFYPFIHPPQSFFNVGEKMYIWSKQWLPFSSYPYMVDLSKKLEMVIVFPLATFIFNSITKGGFGSLPSISLFWTNGGIISWTSSIFRSNIFSTVDISYHWNTKYFIISPTYQHLPTFTIFYPSIHSFVARKYLLY